MTLAEAVAGARRALQDAGIPADEAALDAGLLARRALACDRGAFLTMLPRPADADFLTRYASLVDRRAQREPVAYIIGEREFWGIPFEVTPAVLIPRPETELIVEEALAAYAGRGAPEVIIDVCTGSGCLAVALALEFIRARVVATDISEAALEVARRNAGRNGVAPRISFQAADLLEGLSARADLIVSNPPYVISGEAPHLPPEVREHEPHVALFAGEDGLSCYRRLFPAALARLAPGGRLIVEVGHQQHLSVAALAEENGWRLEHARQDLQGITRTLIFSAAGAGPLYDSA